MNSVSRKEFGKFRNITRNIERKGSVSKRVSVRLSLKLQGMGGGEGELICMIQDTVH
jgi:hypothetical protein